MFIVSNQKEESISLQRVKTMIRILMTSIQKRKKTVYQRKEEKPTVICQKT